MRPSSYSGPRGIEIQVASGAEFFGTWGPLRPGDIVEAIDVCWTGGATTDVIIGVGLFATPPTTIAAFDAGPRPLTRGTTVGAKNTQLPVTNTAQYYRLTLNQQISDAYPYLTFMCDPGTGINGSLWIAIVGPTRDADA